MATASGWKGKGSDYRAPAVAVQANFLDWSSLQFRKEYTADWTERKERLYNGFPNNESKWERLAGPVKLYIRKSSRVSASRPTRTDKEILNRVAHHINDCDAFYLNGHLSAAEGHRIVCGPNTEKECMQA